VVEGPRSTLFEGGMSHVGEQDQVHIGHPAGSRACIHLHGAHLTSWKTPNGQEQIFLSEKAVFNGQKAIRGGIPICFPQFSDFGELGTSHGFARNSKWTLAKREGDSVTLRLSSSDDTKHKHGYAFDFAIEVTYTISESQLSTKLQVTNIGHAEMTYSLALHTYYKVEDVTRARVEGLYRVSYMDSLDGRALKEEQNSHIAVDQEVDRIYLSTPPTCRIVDPMGKKVMSIEKFNLPDIVVWNPWVDKSKRMGDFGDEEYKQMICVETGCIKPAIRLLPGTMWKAEQIISVANSN